VVEGAQSCFAFLAADRESAARQCATFGPLLDYRPHRTFTAVLPHRPKTRVGVFSGNPSGRLCRRSHFQSINTPGWRGCGYKVAPGRRRWPNKDPIGERGGINLYEFVGNDSIDNIDPFGLCCDSEKVPIWICNRKLSGPNSYWPRIGPLSHSFVACEDPSTVTSPSYDSKHPFPAFGKQPRPVGQPGSSFSGPGYVDQEQYWQDSGDFAHCTKKMVCPDEKARQCKTGATQTPYNMFDCGGRNCHSWANGGSQ
jgi:hypothetical protein